MQLRSVRSARVNGRRVLVTAELNVARDRRGRIVDDTRLRAVLPTFRFLRRHRARVIIATHLGRPAGHAVRSLSTRTLVEPLRRALGCRVGFVGDCVGPKAMAAALRLGPGDVLLLENTRFHGGDESNDPRFAKALAALADCFVLESFGTAHRNHASIVGVGQYLPSYAGLRFAEEVRVLSSVLGQPRRPLVVALGGSKISTKLDLMLRLLPKVDALLLGGALANTMLQAKGIAIGASLSEPSMVRRLKHFPLTSRKLHIPVDVIVGRRKARPAVRAVGAVRPSESILDIGPDTVELFRSIIRTARTIVWNGPMGYYERPPFDRGTKAVARMIASARAYSVVGGGETVDAVRAQGDERKIDFISTGGGAMMAFLEGKDLPGVRLVLER